MFSPRLAYIRHVSPASLGLQTVHNFLDVGMKENPKLNVAIHTLSLAPLTHVYMHTLSLTHMCTHTHTPLGLNLYNLLRVQAGLVPSEPY